MVPLIGDMIGAEDVFLRTIKEVTRLDSLTQYWATRSKKRATRISRRSDLYVLLEPFLEPEVQHVCYEMRQ